MQVLDLSSVAPAVRRGRKAGLGYPDKSILPVHEEPNSSLTDTPFSRLPALHLLRAAALSLTVHERKRRQNRLDRQESCSSPGTMSPTATSTPNTNQTPAQHNGCPAGIPAHFSSDSKCSRAATSALSHELSTNHLVPAQLTPFIKSLTLSCP